MCSVIFALLCFSTYQKIVDSGIQSSHTIDINAGKIVAPLHHFWESTGMCPPLPHSDASQYFLSVDMLQNLLLISSVPHQGIKQVRMHWLLEMIKKSGSVYDFEQMDDFLLFLYNTGLKPGFEIMGNPSGYFTNFDDMQQVAEFHELVKQLARRYVAMFGLEYVSSWNFESWNEPDHNDFDNLNVTVSGFLKYYDACSEGLREVSPSLVFGGPGGSCKQPSFSKRCWALFEHVTNGTNFITGKNGSRLDYISFHKKGSGKSDVILQNELDTISSIHQEYPNLVSTPIYNDEADPLVGWSKPQWWRADVTYAALIAKIISQHQNKIIANTSRSSINYALLSNDNGFLNYSPHYFTQRTLNSRFQVNNTNPKYIHFVKKPSLIVMGLLAKLGDEQLDPFFVNNYVGGISSVCNTCSSFEIATLLYNSADSEPIFGLSKITLLYNNFSQSARLHSVKTLLNNNTRAVICSLDNEKTNPHRTWEKMGKPDFPSPADFQTLHDQEGPSCSDPSPIHIDSQGRVVVDFVLNLPGVALHHVCAKPANVPGKPSSLSAFNITVGQVLLTWSDSQVGTKCIKTYQVEYATKPESELFAPVNKMKIIFNSFTYIHSNVVGYYRVAAIDYWNRKGSYSVVARHF